MLTGSKRGGREAARLSRYILNFLIDPAKVAGPAGMFGRPRARVEVGRGGRGRVGWGCPVNVVILFGGATCLEGRDAALELDVFGRNEG